MSYAVVSQYVTQCEQESIVATTDLKAKHRKTMATHNQTYVHTHIHTHMCHTYVC